MAAIRSHVSTSSPATELAPRVIPAQVNFLTIYNQTLGDTEEVGTEQIVFWFDKDSSGSSGRERRSKAKDKDSIEGENHDESTKSDTEEQAVNARLRQVGLAMGMVEFARNFSQSSPLDIVETDRARIILHELEKDWWILASVDLTQLPPTASQTKNNKTSQIEQTQPQVEFSAREVSPATLLKAQLISAHKLFLMHHSATLWDLYHRLGRPQFSTIVNRYWSAFAKRWDVLLHGNPATEIYGNCIKLAGGGELGVGVGEEEWGSGEREVLEAFVERAEGCLECIVGRYGNAPPVKSKQQKVGERGKRHSRENKIKAGREMQEEEWMGCGEDPSPADGIIFSGMGTISPKSLATVSQWMAAIFKYGQSAYGVGENPASQPRQKRKKPKLSRGLSDGSSSKAKYGGRGGVEVHPQIKNAKKRAPDYRKKAMVNNAAPPGIPAPLVGAVERSLDEALAKANQHKDSKDPSPSPKKEKSEDEATITSSNAKDDSSSVFSMEGVKSMLTFGYGSSWTLNPNGFESKDESRPSENGKVSHIEPVSKGEPTDTRPEITRSLSTNSNPAEELLQRIEPNPAVSDEEDSCAQRLEKSIGKFLIGLSGDLEHDEEADETGLESEHVIRPGAQRIFLRTLTIELSHTSSFRPNLNRADFSDSQASSMSRSSRGSTGVGRDPKTSASASIDGPRMTSRHEKVQVAVYVHQPFIFVFLFELHTAKLTIPSFYRSIHHQLGPLQKPLLLRTDPARAASRIGAALNDKHSHAATAAAAVVKKQNEVGNAIYDLVYDPSKNTIRTTIPNIPIPTSPEAAIKTSTTVSGSWYTLGIPIGTSNSPTARLDAIGPKSKIEPWTRVEALNVHTQILNTFVGTRGPHLLERTVKTARAWWVLWMRLSAPDKEDEEFKEAFLIRKSTDYTPSGLGRDNRNSSSSSSNPGRWLLRDQRRDASGASGSGAGGPAGGSKGVSEGLGIDARKWIEGLLSLTQ